MVIHKVSILGAGIMGAGIAQVSAQAGFDVTLIDIEPQYVESGIAAIDGNLDKAVSKGKMTAKAYREILGRISGALSGKEAVADADVVIEAVVEDMAVKTTVFRQLDEFCKKEAVLASNTSGLSITEMAAATRRPENIIGMHFFNPVPVMKLVELVRGFSTGDETVATCRQFAEKLGKTPVEIAEAPGFAVNRILCPMINEAIFVFSEKIASAEDIDRSMVLGANHPIGPLALADMIGLDTLLKIMEGLHIDLGEAKYRPAPFLRKMVKSGCLGKKTGKGFFDYR